MFGWTFTEFDEQPADEVFQFLHLNKIAETIMEQRQKRPSSGWEDY